MTPPLSKTLFRAASLAFSVSGLLLLSACAGTSEDPEFSSSLWGTEWRFLAMGDQDVARESGATLVFTRAESISSSWRLVALSDGAVENHKKRTIVHLQYGQISGNGSCNRFSASASIDVYHLQIGPVKNTKMACSIEAMNQESQYLEALQEARTFEIEKEYLLIRTSKLAQPLRFTRVK
jgi:heat shock protein HslJ